MKIVTARDVALAPLQAEGAVEQIVRRLGEAIGAGVLAPGERLPTELELAAQLGVAPMTLRQALQILRDAGFVETRRGRTGGSFVRDDPPAALVLDGEPPTRSALRELTDWRRAISGEAAALAAERASEDGSPRGCAARRRRPRGAVGEFAAFRLADARFHIAIAEAARSRRLIAAETQIQVEIAEMLRVVPGPRLARAVSQAGHDPIVAAIVAGEAGEARTRHGTPRRGHLRLDRRAATRPAGLTAEGWQAPRPLRRSRRDDAPIKRGGARSEPREVGMRRPSAALVVATAALVMSTIGTSVAATHYVISSPKQIKPGTITLSRSARVRARPCAGNAARAGRRARRAQAEPPGRPGRRDCLRRSSGRRSQPTGASTPRAAE